MVLDAKPARRTAAQVEVIVRGVIWRGEDLLLVQQVGASWWFLPGGHLEANEDLSHCLKRELIEEAQLKISNLRAIGFVEHQYSDQRGQHHELNIFVRALPIGDIGSVEDRLSFRWFPVNTISVFDVRPRGVLDLIRANEPFARLLPNLDEQHVEG